MDPTITTAAPQAASGVTVILAAVISSLGSIIVTWYVASMKAKRRERTTFAQLVSNVQQIKEQIFPNGGSSLRDSINRIEEQQLVDGEMRRAYHHYADVSFWEADTHGNILWANLAYAKLLGISVEELKGHGWMSCIHAEDLYEVEDKISRVVGHDQYLEYRVHRPNRQPSLKLKTRWKRVFNHEGKTVCYVGSVITFEEIK